MEIKEIEKDLASLAFSTEEFPSEHFIHKIVEYCVEIEKRVRNLENRNIIYGENKI